MTILRNRDLWPIHWNIRLDLLEGWLQYVSDPFSGRVVETSIREQLMHRPTQHKPNHFENAQITHRFPPLNPEIPLKLPGAVTVPSRRAEHPYVCLPAASLLRLPMA